MKVSLEKVEELVAKACEGVSEKLAKEVTIWVVGRPTKALERSYDEGLIDDSATKLSGIMLMRPRAGTLLEDAPGLARDLYEHRVPFHPESCMQRGPEGIAVTFPGRAPARGFVWPPASCGVVHEASEIARVRALLAAETK